MTETAAEKRDLMDSVSIVVLGAGSWGTALAHHLSGAGHSVRIWGRDKAVLEAIATRSVNPRYFPNDTLNPNLMVLEELGEELTKAAMIIIAVPSDAVRIVAKSSAPFIAPGTIVAEATKGIEAGTLMRMSEVVAAELPQTEVVSLSGPSFAQEVLRGLPTAVVVAGKSRDVCEKVARWFHHDKFRVYTSLDLVGVELGGVVKNVFALAAGLVDGLGYGSNARAALLTRGLHEMARLVIALGGKASTVSGLSGLGDLILTSTGDLSRNRRVGVRLGQGEKLDDIVASLGQVAEAVTSAPRVYALANRVGVDMPIVEEVTKIISGRTTAEESARQLLTRAMRAEDSL
jgi:glycerol-3-phosphate dehydrogenase (NAD(P)+)